MASDLKSFEDLASWEDYRAFMKERVKQIPQGDCPILVSKEKIEFNLEGKKWKGFAVLLGAKGELAARMIGKDGVTFRKGTFRQKGESFEVHGVPSNLVKAAELTFQKLRLGYSLSGGTEGEDGATPEGQELDARRREIVDDIKEAAGLRSPENAEVLKQAASKAREVEAALKKQDFKKAENLLDEIDELLTEIAEGEEAGGNEDPDLAGLDDWKAYKQFMKAHLKRLPAEGGPFFVSRKKVDFDIEGKTFKGHAVLLGQKARKTVQELKQAGTQFLTGSCKKDGKELLIEGVPMVLIKGARKTFLKLRLGRKIVPSGNVPADDAAAEDAPEAKQGEGTSATDPRLGRVEDGDPQVGMARPFEITASVGRGGKNLEEDVQMVQAALNRRANAGIDVDGKCGPGTIKAIMDFQRALGQFKPDGRVDPGRGTARALAKSGRIGPPPAPPKPIAPPDLGEPSLSKAPKVWNGTRHILDNNIKELKKAIRQEYAEEHPDLLVEIDENVKKVDVILERLDTRLEKCLERANDAKDDRTRAAELKNARAILADYIKYVKEETLIGHLDKNPFGVDTKLRVVITNSLTHMAKSIE